MSHTSETTETSFLVILAYVRLIIPPHCRSKIRRRSNWSLAHHSAGCISSCCILLFVILCVIIQAPVNLIVLLSLQFLTIKIESYPYQLSKQLLTRLMSLANNSLEIYLVYFLSLLKQCLGIPVFLRFRLKNSCRPLIARAGW